MGIVVTKEKEKEIISLYNQGYNDAEISKLINIKSCTIAYYRYTHGLKTNFKYTSKIDSDKIKTLFREGYSDREIATQLHISDRSVWSIRTKLNLIPDNRTIAKRIDLTKFQEEVLIGTVLGDSTLELPKDSINARLSCAHCVQQKEYCNYKVEIFESLGAKLKFQRGNLDKRTNKRYDRYRFKTFANPALTYYHSLFYKDGKKHITQEILDKFTDVSLAFMFMDDGSKSPNSYNIATNCFSIEEINLFRTFLLNKYNIETSIHNDHSTHIMAKSREIFNTIISPYVVQCVRYKLHSPH